MIKRTCLLIDDEKQDDIFPTIITEGRKYGLEIECLQLNVGNQEHREFLENEEINLEKVLNVFREKLTGVKIHLMAFDWNIGSGIKGPEIIKYFNDNGVRTNIPKMLYSGALKEEVEKLFISFRDKGTPFKHIWGQLSTLINTNALVFEQRDTYELGIVEQLRKIEDTVETSIEEELRKFPEFRFNSGVPNKHFKGKTFAEIAEIIEGDPFLRNDFTKDITQQVIAYLAEKI